MPQIKVEGFETFEVEEGKKLVLVLEDNGVPIMHRCGGNARCTTCRVEVLSGDAGPVTEAENQILSARNFPEPNVRLSCQVRCHADITVKPVMLSTDSATDAGPRPQE
jgi:ferredoxin